MHGRGGAAALGRAGMAGTDGRGEDAVGGVRDGSPRLGLEAAMVG